MGNAGGQPGNQNARKHGFYSSVLDEAEQAELEAAARVEGLEEEIAMLRLSLTRLIKEQPDRLDLQLAAINAIAWLVRTEHKTGGARAKSLRAAIHKLLAEVAVPAGIDSINVPEDDDIPGADD